MLYQAVCFYLEYRDDNEWWTDPLESAEEPWPREDWADLKGELFNNKSEVV
jgi:hypothetical protein